MVNILLIDQEPLFQQAFSKMITETEDCQLVGIAENSKEAVSYTHLCSSIGCGKKKENRIIIPG